MENYYDPADGERFFNFVLDLKPLSYFDLMNAFQFSIPIYLFLFSLLSIVTVIGIIIFWFIN
jgi:hypothetical protein